jgi:hypothetical protein
LAGTHFLSYNFTIFVAGRCGDGDTSRCFFLAPEKQTQRSTEIQRDRDVDEREREREREKI